MLIIAGSILVACGNPQSDTAANEDKKQEQQAPKDEGTKNDDQVASEDKKQTEDKTNEKEQAESQKTPDLKTQTANKVAMSVVDIISKAQGSDISVELVFDIKNNNTAEQGVGANDYRIRDGKGKEYRIDGKRANFGDAIAPKQTLTGSAFFVLPKAVKNFTLVYQPADKVEAEWELELK